MDEVRSDELHVGAIQAERIELLDSKGRVRAVLGDLGSPDDGYVPGLKLIDRQGQERSAYALFGWGPSLDFASDGNAVLILGVNDDLGTPDDASTYDPSAYIVLADGDGDLQLETRVHYNGNVEMKGPDSVRS